MHLIPFFKSPLISAPISDILVFLHEKGLTEAANELSERANKADAMLTEKAEKQLAYTSTWKLNDMPEESKKWYQKWFQS